MSEAVSDLNAMSQVYVGEVSRITPSSLAAGIDNLSKMAEAISGIGDSYVRTIQSAQRMCEGLQRFRINPDFITSVQSAQRMLESLSIAIPKVYYTPNAFDGMIKLTESFSKLSILGERYKDVYEAFSRKSALQTSILWNDNFKKLGESIKLNTANFEVLSANLQRAATAVDVAKYSDFDELKTEDYNEYSFEIEQVLAGDFSDEEIAEKNNKSGGKLAKILYNFILFFISTFFAGYLQQYVFQPAYKLINKVIVLDDVGDLSKEIGQPSEGTRFLVWARKDGYVEISYEDNDEHIQGYISEKDFNSNSELVEEGIDDEQVLFLSKCLLSMSNFWNVDSDEVYKRLSEDSDTFKGYIIPEFDRLSKLSEEQLVQDIDKEYLKRTQSE